MDQNNTIFDDFSIKAAAKSELNMAARTSFSSDGFTSAQTDVKPLPQGFRHMKNRKNN